MALLAALLPPLALAFAQQAAEVPFACELPADYPAFAPVAGQAEAWESAARDGSAHFLVRRFQLESAGARAAGVARQLRDQVWGPARIGVRELEFTEFAGGWGGVPETAGHTVRYRTDDRRLAAVERFAVLHDQLVHFLWDGPEAGLPAALDAAASFRVPDAWIPAPPPDRDLHRGLAPGSEARALPWSLEVRLDFVSRRDDGDVEIGVRARPADGGAPLSAAEAAWRLPPGAQAIGPAADGFFRYRLPAGDLPEQPLAAFGLIYSPQGDLAALDAAGWLAVPETPPGPWLPPSWTLEALHPGHSSLLAPAPWSLTSELGEAGASTRVGPVPAGLCWPLFVTGRFQKRLSGGATWQLRLDAKAIVPDEAVDVLLRLAALDAQWMGGGDGPAPAVLSFPGLGDRALPGLFVLDETRDWFNKAADSALGGLDRRAWLARLVAGARFGGRLRGSGSAAPVLENALAEWYAARLCEAAGFEEAAAALRSSWTAAEAAAGPLPTPLALMPAEEIFAAGRLRTGGARFWTALEAFAGRAALDGLLRGFAAAGAPWTTRELEAALAASLPPERADGLRAFLDAHLYGTRKP